MTHEPTKTTLIIKWVAIGVSLSAWVFASFVLIEPAIGARLTKTELYGVNIQNMRLLQSNLGIEIIGPLGGSDEILVYEGALATNLSTITNTKYKIENICNPRNDSIEIYKVRDGDTLGDIAEMFCVSTNTIRWANNISGSIHAGDELTILPISGVMHDVEKGDTIAKIVKLYGGSVDAVLAYNNIELDETLTTEMSIIVPNGKKATTTSTKTSSYSGGSYASAQGGYYIKPTAGRITSNFGTRRDPISGRKRIHKGTDIANSRGTTIVAAAGGRVIEARPSGWNGGYGRKVMIQHANGTKTLYAHMNSVTVKVGQMVNQGQKIGTMGRTGRVTGVHLHFEIIKGSTYLKPSF